MVVWKKKGTDSYTVQGQTTRSWSSADGRHTKVRVTRRGPEQKTASLVSLRIDGVELAGKTHEERRAHLRGLA